MGNGASSSQGGFPSHDPRDARSSVAQEQHDWQTEQAVAPKPETLSLQQGTRKSYTINADVISETYADMATGTQQIRRFQRPHSSLNTSQQETPSNIYK